MEELIQELISLVSECFYVHRNPHQLRKDSYILMFWPKTINKVLMLVIKTYNIESIIFLTVYFKLYPSFSRVIRL